MTRYPLLAVMAVAVGCGGCAPRVTEGQGADVVCALLATQVDVRLAEHRRNFARHSDSGDAFAGQDGLSTLLQEMANSTIIVRELALSCVRSEAQSCGVMSPDAIASDVVGALQQLKALSEGLRGRGSCAAPRDALRRKSVSDLCRIEYQLAAEQVTPDQWEVIRAARQQPRDQLGRPHPGAALATHVLSRWRVEIDYGLALAPACAQPWVAASCEHLRRGLDAADPEELLARLHALSAAYAGAPCTASR